MRYIDKFKTHPSVMKIKDMINIDKTFNFDFIDIKNMPKTIYSLDTTKSNPITSIPAKILINNGDIFIPILHNNLNNNIINGIFPLNLKLSDITPTHKKKDRILKENYKPISILPAVSKMYENLMAEQLNIYLNINYPYSNVALEQVLMHNIVLFMRLKSGRDH